MWSGSFYNPVALLRGYALFNPHAAFCDATADLSWQPTVQGWTKWLPNRKTSPHWYTPERLRPLIAGYLLEDKQRGQSRTVRQFLEEFGGITGSHMHQDIAQAVGLHRANLNALLRNAHELDMDRVRQLLRAMQERARPIKPQLLGVLGEAHCAERLAQEYGVEPETLTYRCDKQTTSDGLPYVIEAACGWSQDEEAAADARLCGYNFSPCLRTPFPALDQWCDDVDIEYRDHVVLMVHLACPRLDATDSGKTAVVLPGEITTAMAAVVQKVTQRWTKMKKTARRTSRREAQEAERERRRHRPMSTKQACDQVMEQAYLKASDQGRGPANARQIMYAARPWVIELTGKDKPWKRSQQFTQGYLIQFIEAHPDLTAQWDVVFDARGHFREPHARRPAQRFDIGTVDVRRYLQDWQCRLVPSIAFNINTDLDTLGPTFRYRYALFVEKEGFDEHFAQARLAERYDLALMSTKGQTTTSARRLVDELSQAGVTILVLHDLDKSGLEILRMFTTSNHRYHYKSEPRVIDLGLRWADVDAMGLEREDVAYRKKFDPRPGLRAAGASAEELAMLASRYDRWGEKWTGQRVELNAMTTPQLLGWLEGKLHALGVEKVVPEGGTLATIWRYYTQLGWLNTELKTVRSRMPPDAAIVVPDDLAQQVRARIQNTALPWEQAVEALVDEARATA